MNISKISIALCAGLALTTLASAPASAASATTAAFLSNLGSNVDFLDRSSRTALDHSSAAAVRSFARAEAQEAAKVASALGDAMPADYASKVAAVDADGLLTGRSVAVDEVAGGETGGIAANGRSPLGRAELTQLMGTTGASFDNLYWEMQLDALSQIESDYRTYIASGDDAALVALSKRELPKIMKRLVDLTKI